MAISVGLRGLRLAAAILVTAALYVATARLGLAFALPPDFKATAVWPPSGIALAALLLCGWRAWPGVFAGAFLANAWDYFSSANTAGLTEHALVAFGIAVGSTLQALIGAFLIHLLIDGQRILERSRAVAKFIVLVPIACTIAPTIGLATSAWVGLSEWSAFAANWPTWWIGDTVGIYIVTPFILAWAMRRSGPVSFERVIEGIAILVLVAAVSMLVFGDWSSLGPFGASLPYVTLPPIILAKFRLGPKGATTSLLVLAAIAVWGTSRGYGPFHQAASHDVFTSLQAFLGITAVTVLLVTGVLAEKREAETAKTTLIADLERAIGEIRTLQEIIPICAWCKKIRTDTGAWQQIEAYISQHTDAQFSHGICPSCREKVEEARGTTSAAD